MQFYKEEGKEFDYYSYDKSSGAYQKPTTYSNTGYEQSYYKKDPWYETNPGMMGSEAIIGLGNGFRRKPCEPMIRHVTVDYGLEGERKTHTTRGNSTDYNTYGMGYGTDYNTHGMGYGNNTYPLEYGNHRMHKPASNGLGLGTGMDLGHVMGFGPKHEGHGVYGMGSSGCTTYKKQHRRRKGMGGYGSGSDCSDDDRCLITKGFRV